MMIILIPTHFVLLRCKRYDFILQGLSYICTFAFMRRADCSWIIFLFFFHHSGFM
jgi:hypothetical protein